MKNPNRLAFLGHCRSHVQRVNEFIIYVERKRDNKVFAIGLFDLFIYLSMLENLKLAH